MINYDYFSFKCNLLLDQLLKDPSREVKLGISKSLDSIFIKSNGALISSIKTIIGTLLDNEYWRIRLEVYRVLGNIAKFYGQEVFTSNISRLFFKFFREPVHIVREEAVKQLEILCNLFGRTFGTNDIIPILKDVFNSAEEAKMSYSIRKTALNCLVMLIPIINFNQIHLFVIPKILACLKDPVVNLRIYTIRIVMKYMEHLDRNMKDIIKVYLILNLEALIH